MHAVQELVDPLGRDPGVEAADLHLRVDLPRHVFQHDRFRAPERGHGGADLAVEVGQVEAIEIGDREGADPEPREGQQVGAAGAAEPRDRDPLRAER